MATGAIGVSSFASSSSYFARKIKATPSSFAVTIKFTTSRNIVSSAAQESPSISTVDVDQPKQEKAAPAKDVAAAPAKSKAAAKAPAKPLPQLIQEDVIPPLQKILEAQDDLSEIELTFEENTLEGTFLKKGQAHSFWAFFPDGSLTGAKGFALSSYGMNASTVEPFLIDEKRITSKHIVFWVEKRLAAQGIIPVWK